jgi:hypothetical protein
MLLNSFILTQNQKQLMTQKPKTAEKQNATTKARKNMATKINCSSKRQQMNNKPIMDSFHTNSYNNKNNYQRIKPPQNHSSQLKNIPISKCATSGTLGHPLFCHPIHILPPKALLCMYYKDAN